MHFLLFYCLPEAFPDSPRLRNNKNPVVRALLPIGEGRKDGRRDEERREAGREGEEGM